MKLAIPQNLRTEKHPFRQVSVTSFIIGGLLSLLAIVLLLSVKSNFKAGHFILAIEKIIAGVGFITFGIKLLLRGYQKEHDFNLEEVFDPSHGRNINYLLAQRHNIEGGLAGWYAHILHSKSFSLTQDEKRDLKDSQALFYKLFSRNGLSKIFDFVPYPITNFIANQARPLLAIGIGLLTLIIALFFSYLELLPFSITWVNLFILIALLSIWAPSKIDTVLESKNKYNIQIRIIFFIAFFIITVALFKSYTDEINISLLLSLLFVVAIMVLTSLGSFKLIDTVFSKREKVNVNVSAIDLVTHRADTQPANILQQMDKSVLAATNGWFFQGATKKLGGMVAGEEHKKGDFGFEYLYETQPKLLSTQYDEKNEKKLSLIWKAGTIMLSIGVILVFAGIFVMPGIDKNLVTDEPASVLKAYSPGILLSLYLGLLGIAFYFFGNRLVYEVYLFFNTEIFFESNLILVGVNGNYDEFEHISGNTKRKDTFTHFTPEIMTCRVISSVFMHPYMKINTIQSSPRFITKIEGNDELLGQLQHSFAKNMGHYMPNLLDDL